MKTLRGMIIAVLLLVIAISMMSAAPPDGKGPGQPDIPDTGELYGDLYVIDRDEDGVPRYMAYTAAGDEYGIVTGAATVPEDYILCVRPISEASGTEYFATADGVTHELVFEINEPFELFTYINVDAEVEYTCEVLEVMLPYVQEVDFGRLNVGRSPEMVLEHAFDEAISTMNEACNMRFGAAGRLQLWIPDADLLAEDVVEPPVDCEQEFNYDYYYYWKTIDSPLENLGLYKQLMIQGHWVTPEGTLPEPHSKPRGGQGPPSDDGPAEPEPRPVLNEKAGELLSALGLPHLALLELGVVDGVPVTTHTAVDLETHEMLMGANLLSGAADKGSTIGIDKVVYLNSIYGINQATGGTLTDALGKKYFNFQALGALEGTAPYVRSQELVNNRWHERCGEPAVLGQTWVLVTADEGAGIMWGAACVDIGEVVFGLAGDPPAVVDQSGANIDGFSKAATDAIAILTYVHNYHVPELLDYPVITVADSLQSLASHPLMPTPR